jgi:hypothetical protein
MEKKIEELQPRFLEEEEKGGLLLMNCLYRDFGDTSLIVDYFEELQTYFLEEAKE